MNNKTELDAGAHLWDRSALRKGSKYEQSYRYNFYGTNESIDARREDLMTDTGTTERLDSEESEVL